MYGGEVGRAAPAVSLTGAVDVDDRFGGPELSVGLGMSVKFTLVEIRALLGDGATIYAVCVGGRAAVETLRALSSTSISSTGTASAPKESADRVRRRLMESKSFIFNELWRMRSIDWWIVRLFDVLRNQELLPYGEFPHFISVLHCDYKRLTSFVLPSVGNYRPRIQDEILQAYLDS